MECCSGRRDDQVVPSKWGKDVLSSAASETLWKRSSVIVVGGRARCERWPRPGLHPTQRTWIVTYLSRMNSSWSSIQSSFSEHLSRPPTGVRTDQVVATPGLPKERAYSRENCPILVCEGSAQLFGAVRKKSRPGSFQKLPGLPRDVAKWKKIISKLGRKGSRKPVHPVRGADWCE